MALAPNSCGRHEEKACDAYSEQVIARSQRHCLEVSLEQQCQSDCVCGKERTQRRCDDREDGENDEDRIALP